MGWFDKIFPDDQHLIPLWDEYKQSLKKLNKGLSATKQKYLILDCETSGLDIKNDAILSLGWLPVDDMYLDIQNSKELFIKNESFKTQATVIHGLTKEDLKDGKLEKDVLIKLLSVLKGRVIVGHHIGFDIAMLNRQMKFHFNVTLKNPVLDSGSLYKIAFPVRLPSYSGAPKKVYSLDNIAEEFKIDTYDRHSAIGDVYITGVIFLKIIKLLKKKQIYTLKEILDA